MSQTSFWKKQTSLIKQLIIWIPVAFYTFIIGVYVGAKMEKRFWADEVGIEFESANRGNFAIISTYGDRQIEIQDCGSRKIIKITKIKEQK